MTTGKSASTRNKLYDYQRRDLDKLFTAISDCTGPCRLLYQLPTGGGKTVIFSEIAKKFIRDTGKKVIILTHRVELCRQTSATLQAAGIRNKIINSSVKTIRRTDAPCFVAMVETLKNRIEEGQFDPRTIGLVIIDEAHHNAFQKLMTAFDDAIIIGVTATPLSSDPDFPMRDSYERLITGEPINALIQGGYLATPKTWRYDVELNTLQTGAGGDFTITTSDELYSSPAMLELLLQAYEANAKNKKTLIFNNGIFTSRNVCEYFKNAGYPIRHLDNSTSATEREEILLWLKKTKNAILTSVSILTTGFDEPSIQAVILNRATTSLTLFHQMIGRGSRRLPNKKTFTIIDLGNNIERFGEWQAPVDWQYIFDKPEEFTEKMNSQLNQDVHQLPSDLRSKFPNTLELSFDVQEEFRKVTDAGQKPINVLRDSIRQHAVMCVENADTVADALALAKELEKEIDWRVKQYTKCLGSVTRNYREWLQADYRDRLHTLIPKLQMKWQSQPKVA